MSIIHRKAESRRSSSCWITGNLHMRSGRAILQLERTRYSSQRNQPHPSHHLAAKTCTISQLWIPHLPPPLLLLLHRRWRPIPIPRNALTTHTRRTTPRPRRRPAHRTPLPRTPLRAAPTHPPPTARPPNPLLFQIQALDFAVRGPAIEHIARADERLGAAGVLAFSYLLKSI